MNNYLKHESAVTHVTGEAVYVDDIPVDQRLLVGHVVYSKHAHARIKSFDLTVAKKVPGVHSVLCFNDIPGENQMGPVVRDEPCLAEKEVKFVGQVIFLIAGESEEVCREAEQKIKIKYEPVPSILTLDESIKANNLLGPERKIKCGNVEKALKESHQQRLLKVNLEPGPRNIGIWKPRLVFVYREKRMKLLHLALLNTQQKPRHLSLKY